MTGGIQHFTFFVFSFEEGFEYILLVIFSYADALVNDCDLNLELRHIYLRMLTLNHDQALVIWKLDRVRNQVE